MAEKEKVNLNKLRSKFLKKSIEKDKKADASQTKKPADKAPCSCSGESSPLKDMVQKIAGLGLPGMGQPENPVMTRTVMIIKPAEGVKKVLEKDGVDENTSPFVRKCLKMFKKD